MHYLLKLTTLLLLGALLKPQAPIIPVQDATINDWNHETFWYHPWGKKGVHDGIDIFADRGTPALAPVHGFVAFEGEARLGGKVVFILGPNYRLHYLAHLDTIEVRQAQFVRQGQQIGRVGNTGSAENSPPHVHYSIISIVPQPDRIDDAPRAWMKMWFLNPHEILMAALGHEP